MNNIYASSQGELEAILRARDITVRPREEKKRKEDSEWWSICRLLSTLNGESKLSFPLSVIKSERPDFEVCLGETAWGIEATEAVTESHAEELNYAERNDPDGIIDGPEWGDEAGERALAEMVRRRVADKTKKLRGPNFQRYRRNVLLVYDNMPMPSLHHGETAAHCSEQLEDYWSEQLGFDAVYLDSWDMLYEITSRGVWQVRINDIWTSRFA